MLQINARSIDSSDKFDKFKNFLMEIKFKIDVIVVGESNLSYDTTGLHNLPSFIQYPACRNTLGGGLSFYVNSRLQHKFIEKVDSNFFQ